MRSATSMNSGYASAQPQRTSRLQNTQKTAAVGLGNGAGWGQGGVFGSGFGGLGGAPGLGAGARPGGLTGFAQVMGGGGGQGPIDMSDFPSLSGGPQPSSNVAAQSWNSGPIRQQQAGLQRQVSQPQTQPQRAPSTAPSQQSTQDQFESIPSRHNQGSERTGGDEFPPLGGQLNGDAFGGQGDVFSQSLKSPETSQAQPNGPQTQLPFREGSNPFPQVQPSLQQPQTSPNPQQVSQSQPQANGQGSTVKRWADMTENERYGMPGLLAAFEARRQYEAGGTVDDTLPLPMRNGIFMGQDLSTLGLDLDSPDPLIPTFFPFPGEGRTGSMYDFHDRHVVPDFHIPSAYTVTNVPPLQSRIGSFSDETLFSIFYQHPHDTVQELAALELTNREWRWHKILRQWLQKDTRESSISSSTLPTIDLTNGAPYGAPSQRLGDRGERGIFIFFDAANWRRERREFVLNYEELDTRLASGGPATMAAMTGAAAGMSAGPMGAAGAPLPGVGGSGSSGVGSSGVGGVPTSAGG